AGDAKWIKVNVLESTGPVPVALGLDDVRIDPGIEGLALGDDLRAFSTAEELVVSGLVDENGKVDAKRLAARWAKLNGIGSGDVTAKQLRALRWHGLFVGEGDDEVLRLYRGHRTFADVTPEQLIDSAHAAGQYLARVTQSDGKFKYEYNPITDDYPPSYNIVRHAGTTYAMFELQGVRPDVALLDAANRALGYLVEQAKPTEVNGMPASCVVEDRQTKLGGNALAVVAIAKCIEVTGDRRHLDLARQIADWIVLTQNPEGQFTVHTRAYPAGPQREFESAYYPGEAVLALCRLHDIDPQPKWLDAAERGAKWLINVRDGLLRDDQLSHDHWLLYALNDLHRQRPDDLYVRHNARICREIIKAQHRTPKFDDWIGGYYNPPRSNPTATRTEGLCAAHRLLMRVGQKELAGEVLEAVRLGVRFQLQTQLRPEQAMHFARPDRALGGFAEHLTDLDIRIDTVQHNISGVLGAYDLLRQRVTSVPGKP
ncbi:MAG: hypothetical protein ACREIT_04055, partial [Tepidisphaeraceae bacterium]